MAALTNDELQNDVASIFLSYFARAPEFEAMEYYVEQYIELLAAEGDNPAAHANAFKNLSAQIYVDGAANDEVPSGSTVTDAWYVDYLYENVLGRAPDEGGREYWINQLGEGNIERPELVGILLRSAEAGEGRDADYVANRTLVAVEFSQWENSNPSILDDLPFNAAEVMQGVNEDPASVQPALDRLYENAGHDGETFDLTPGIDTFEGTTLDDVFNAYPNNPADGASATTLNEFDTIDGGAGYDTFNIYVEGENNATQQGTVSNVELVQVHSVDGVSTLEEADLNAYQGVQAFWQQGAATDVTNANGDTVVGYANVTVAGADATLTTQFSEENGAIALQGVSTDADSPDGEDGRLVAAGEALQSLILLDDQQEDEVQLQIEAGRDVESFTLNTEVDVDLESLGNHADSNTELTGLDASGSTGDIMVRDADALLNAALGAGNDVLVFERAPNLQQTIDGGEGFDVAALGAASFQTQDYDAINLMSNIEALAFYNSEATIELDAAQVSDFEMLAFGAPGESDSITANVRNLAETQGLLVTDDETVTLTLFDAAANVNLEVSEDALAMLAVNADELGDEGGTLTLSGEGDVGRFDAEADDVAIADEGFNNSAGKFSTIDAQELQGQFTLAGMSAAVAETILLGEGESAITVNVSFNEEVASSSSLGLMDSIAFPNEDTVEILGFGGEVQIALDDGVSTLEQAFAQAAAQYAGIANDQGWSTAAGAEPDDIGVLWFEFDGDTYLYADTVAADQQRYDNGDFALQLVGEIEG